MKRFKYAIFEIPMLTTSSGPQFNFPVNNYLVGRTVFAMESYNSNDIDKSPISTNNVTWSPTQMAAASLTLHCFDPNQPTNSAGKADWIKQMPVNTMHRLFNTVGVGQGVSAFQVMLFGEGLIVDWNNSFVTFTANQTFAVNTSGLFGIYYL